MHDDASEKQPAANGEDSGLGDGQEEKSEDTSPSEIVIEFHSEGAGRQEHALHTESHAALQQAEEPVHGEREASKTEDVKREPAEDLKHGMHPLQTDTESPSDERYATPTSARSRAATSATSPITKDIVEQLAQSPTLTHRSKASVSAPFSQFSHQQLARQDEEVVIPENEEGEWQEMPALATHRVYDDWGKVIAKSYDEVEDEAYGYSGLGGAGKGYTKVHIDDDVESQTSFDDNTAYLFQDGYARNALDEEDEARDIISQMQTTKGLLTEGQKIAYVGVVRLTINQMVQKQDTIERTRPVRKAVDFASESMRLWSQKIMIRVYSHMEIDSQEQVMVEQLAEHGVLPADLVPALMQNARVKNPKPKEGDEATNGSHSLDSPGPLAGNSQSKETLAPATNGSSEHIPVPSRTHTPEQSLPSYEQTTADGLYVERPEDLPNTKDIDLDLRWTVLCDLFLLLIADGTYDARSRMLLEKVGAALSIEWTEICRFEKRVTDALEMQEQSGTETWNQESNLEARRKATRNKRLVVMGLCTVGGGLVIGLSAGLLAPVIGAGLAAGFTSIGVAGTSSFLGGAGAAALIGTTGAGIGGRIGLNASNRRTGAVKTFEYRPLHNNKRVNLIITVSGWMAGGVDDVRLPFSTVDPVMGDIYSVLWEPEMLQSTGQTIQILATEALTQTIQQIIGATALSTLMAGLAAPIVLTKLAYLIDNPWTVSLARADAAGLILADSLIDRNLGARPITLVGFSLGSRLIFAALQEMAKRGAIGIVQNVYLFGSPIVTRKDEWTKAKTIVSGRLVNGFASHDWVLGYLFRATSGGLRSIAGLSKVPVSGVENVDFSEIVPGHMAYRGMMPILLREVGWEVESEEFTEIDDPDPDNHDKRQRELISDIEEARRQLEEKDEKKGFLSRFTRRKAPAKKAWETYDEKQISSIDTSKDAETIVKENANVLFDVEAIRREALELAKQGEPVENITAHMNIREIKSTLPPMRISSSSLTPPMLPNASNEALRQTRSHDEPTRSFSFANGVSSTRESSTRPSVDSRGEHRDSNGTGVENSGENSARPSLQSHATAPNVPTTSVHDEKPESKNAWAEEEEFGQEKEIEMSFE